MGPIIVFGIIIILFIILGTVFYSGRGAFLIAGYNTMPQKEKDVYDIVALCKFMGKMMYALTFSIILWMLSELLGKTWLFTVGIILFLCKIVFMLVYMNTGNRFKK